MSTNEVPIKTQGNITEKHKELFHYTSADGLRGILETQTLWGTHYKDLNDSSEIRYMREHLPNRLSSSFTKIAKDLIKDGFRSRREVKKFGGLEKIALHEATTFIDVFYRGTFEGFDGVPFCTPFIVSFCGHSDESSWEYSNGLLSQWRSYARGGYAIVFDTAKLDGLFKFEASLLDYQNIIIGDIIYDGDEEAFQDEFGFLTDSMSSLYREFLKTGTMDPAMLFGDILSSFTRFKHPAFYEEREVRIVASPTNAGVRGMIKADMPDEYEKLNRPKQIHSRRIGSTDIRYIKLFDFGDDGPGLPIKRIIVGPDPEQDSLASQAHDWCAGKNIEIIYSQTPYVERK